MLHIPNMIMIGAGNRHSGQSELGRRLLRKFSADYRVIVLKVITHPDDGDISSPDDKQTKIFNVPETGYLLKEEKTDMSGDAGRMPEAGAHQVYRLTANRSSLAAGMQAFVTRIGHRSDEIIVCQSNRLRSVVVPGLFLISRNIGDKSIMPACREVWAFKDRTIWFDDKNKAFDVEVADINYLNGSWTLSERAAAIILAGGKSSRMGRDKSLMVADDVPLIEKVVSQLRYNFPEIVISANNADKYRFLDLPVIPDQEEGKGPLMGIYSALRQTKHTLSFVVACDIPDLNMPYIRLMLEEAPGHQIVVPMRDNGKIEPLFAVYGKSVLDNMKRALDAGERKIRAVFDLADVRYLPLSDDRDWLKNLNTPQDYHNYLKRESAK